MSPGLKRTLWWGAIVVALVAGLFWSLRPRPMIVDLASVTRGPMTVTVDEEGKSRVREVFVVSATVTGRVRRTRLDVGDAVLAGETVVAEIEPGDPAFLDVRARAEAEAAVAQAEAALRLAEAEVDQAQAELDFASAELTRAKRLASSATISEQAVDDALRAFRSRRAALATASASVQVKSHALAQARSRLTTPSLDASRAPECECVVIRAPVSGRVLEIHQESEGDVLVGAPLVSLGDAADLEIVSELLSTEAVRIAAGMRVVIDGWGGPKPLEGVVQRIEPFAFTKLSALGIEEQRVNVVIGLRSEPEQWLALGHGFRVDVHVVIWEAPSVLMLPVTALFRHGEDLAVFVESDGVARLTPVRLGHRSGLRAQVLDGVDEGDKVVISPSDRIEDGVRVAGR